MKRINGIKLKIGEDESLLIAKTAKLAGVSPNKIKSFEIVRHIGINIFRADGIPPALYVIQSC